MMLVACIYRVIPARPYGFAPQLAVALFAGAVISNKKWAILLPLFSMFFSDLLYHFMFTYKLGNVPGFYDGQWVNYLLYTGVILIGFLMKKITIKNIALFSLIGPTAYFLSSNFVVWVGGGGWGRPKTFSGLLQCYEDGVPFYTMSLLSTLIFCTVLFGSWFLIYKKRETIAIQ